MAQHRWQPGTSGNPGGRPKKTQTAYDLEEACRLASEELLPIAMAIAKGEIEGCKPSDRMAAVNAIWNRAHGAPRQKAEVDTTIKTAAVAIAPSDVPIDDMDAFVAQALGDVPDATVN